MAGRQAGRQALAQLGGKNTPPHPQGMSLKQRKIERDKKNISPTPLAERSLGGVAQMVERSLSMREVPGSIPGASSPSF